MGWRNRPKYIDYCPNGVDYIIFIDENGDTDLKYIKDCIRNGVEPNSNSVYFTITGVIVKRDDLKVIKEDIMNVKCKYWEDGCFEYKEDDIKRVCFHSREIRRKEGPFSIKKIVREDFLQDISSVMEDIPCKIISSTINKKDHVKKYISPDNPYNLCLNFVMERIVKFYLKSDETAIVVLESRGKKEDKNILNHIKYIIDNGTNCINSEYFNKIKGVYFNPKWQRESKDKKSYFGLEIADLYSYPIHKYCKNNEKDRAFKSFEKKIYKYPNYFGCGIKKFPK